MGQYQAMVVGVSAGAVEALSSLFSGLPGDFPLSTCVVVHLPPDKDSVLPELLQMHTTLAVKEAEDKEPMEAGTVYIAPPDYHLQVEPDHSLSLSAEAPVLFSRPSVDVLFETAAEAFGEGLIGVVLTGASSDGARGLRKVIDCGGRGIVQQPKDAHAPTMPQAAIALCPEAEVLSLKDMATTAYEMVGL